MAKMNWGRVPNWDRVRDGRSDMEFADQRESSRSNGNGKREEARAERAASGASRP